MALVSFSGEEANSSSLERVPKRIFCQARSESGGLDAALDNQQRSWLSPWLEGPSRESHASLDELWLWESGNAEVATGQLRERRKHPCVWWDSSSALVTLPFPVESAYVTCSGAQPY